MSEVDRISRLLCGGVLCVVLAVLMSPQTPLAASQDAVAPVPPVGQPGTYVSANSSFGPVLLDTRDGLTFLLQKSASNVFAWNPIGEDGVDRGTAGPLGSFALSTVAATQTVLRIDSRNGNSWLLEAGKSSSAAMVWTRVPFAGAELGKAANKGKPGWLGVGVEDADNDEATPGLRITEVRPGGPAEKHGLQVGDILFTADGKELKSYEELRDYVASRKGGDVVAFKVVRTIMVEGKPSENTLLVNVTLGARD